MKVFAIRTQRNPARPIDFLNFQKDTGRDTILILVYIHTYPVFARRINIDFSSCATHRIEIPKRTRLGFDFTTPEYFFGSRAVRV